MFVIVKSPEIDLIVALLDLQRSSRGIIEIPSRVEAMRAHKIQIKRGGTSNSLWI